jgi:conjugal transfer pilus assembly protein TraV
MKYLVFVVIATSLTVSGCSSLSGLDAKDNFTCKATGGVSCENMTTIYNRTQARTLPAQQTQSASGGVDTTSTFKTKDTAPLMSTGATSGQALRSEPSVVRLWIAPWIDVDGDLHDASYVYLTIGQGRWLIEHTRQQIMQTHGPRRAVPKEQTLPISRNESAPVVAPNGVSDIAKDPAAMEIIKRMMGGQQQ